MDCVYPLRFGVILSLLSISLASDLKVGFAEFERTSPGANPAASSLFSITNPQGILVSEAGVESSILMKRGRIFVQQDRQVGTGIALANPSNASLVLNLVLRDSSGQVIGQNGNFKLDVHQHVARFVSELFSNVPADFTGSLTFEVAGTGEGVAAVTLRQSANLYGEPILTTLPVVNLDIAGGGASPGEFIFPHLGAGPGFSTQLILINPRPTRSEGVIHLFSSNGKKLDLQSGATSASSFPFAIEPDGIFFSEFAAPASGGLGVGYARVQVTSGSLPSGSAIFRYTEAGQPIAEAGVGAPPRMKKARLFVDTRDTSTGFAVVNPGTTLLNLTLRLIDANGRLQSESSRQLAAGNHLAQFAGEAFQLSPRFVGMLEIEGNGNFVPITLKLSQNSRRHAILTTLPVANLSAPVSDTLLVLPQVATGSSVVGEFLTRLIFIAPVQNQHVSGNLHFWQGLGEPLQLTSFDGAMPYLIEGSALGEIVFSESTRESVLDKRGSISAEIGAEGGSLTLEGCLGNRVSLSIPPFALLSAREVKMTCLGSRPVDTLGTNLFPGVLLEPSGLVFRYPAELTIFLSQPMEDPGRSSIFTVGVDGIPRPILNESAGQFLAGKVFHFSEYWADSANLADLLKQIEWINWAKRDPEVREKLLEKFREEMGYELEIEKLDVNTLDYLLRLSDLNTAIQFEDLADTTNIDVDVFRNFLEALVLDFVASPPPKNPCGYFHSFAVELRRLSEFLPEPNPDLAARILELDTSCVLPGLNGWWRALPQAQAETCERIVEPVVSFACPCGEEQGFDRFFESDVSDSYRFLINQVGSNFTMSFPDEPGAPSFVGTVQATGDASYPFHLTVAVPPEDSLDCKNFFETKGSFEPGDAICVPDYYNECEPVSCFSREQLFAKVTRDGRIEGVASWLIGASVIEWLEGCCDYLTSIACSGSGPFVAVRD